MRYLLAALGRARCPMAIDQVFAGKIAITSLDLLLRCQSRERLRRPWMSGVPGARSTPLAGKTSRRWVPSQRFDPPCFFTACFGTEPKIGSHGASGRLRSHTAKYFAWGWWRTMDEVDLSGSSWSYTERVMPISSALSNARSCFWSARLGQAG